MNPGDGSEQSGEVRVTDRRRFTESGDERESGAPSEARSAEPVAADAGANRPAPIGADEGQPAPGGSGRAHATPSGTIDLGIEAVFFVFYQSALIALGVPEATGGHREPDLVDARQAIDFLRILEAKTAGNLTAAEADTLRQLLDDAQLKYVHVARGLAGGRA